MTTAATTRKIHEQVQAGLDARLARPVDAAAHPLAAAYRTLFGWDGSSVDDAVEAAWTPTGPSREAIRARIEFRRAHPHLLRSR